MLTNDPSVGDYVDNGDGTVTLKVRKALETYTVGGYQHGVLEVRTKDILNNNFMFDNNAGDAGALDYETDGVTFTSTTANTTNTSVGSGGEFHVIQYFRPTVDDNIWGDIGGSYMLVEAPVSIWNEPTVRLNGVLLANVKGQMNSDESKAYTGYEEVYKYDSFVKRQQEAAVDLDLFALSGVDPASGIEIDHASRGAFASVSNSNIVKEGAVDDSTSLTQIHTLIDTNYFIN